MPQSSTISKSGNKHLTASQAIGGILDYCKREEYGLAVWRDPHSGITRGVIDFYNERPENDLPLEEMSPGFLFASYDRHATPYFIKACVQFVIDDGVTFEAGAEMETGAILDNIQQFLPLKEKFSLAQNEVTDSGHFLEIVRKAVEAIRAGEFLKVVPSRSSIHEVSGLDIPGLFLALRDKYPAAFVSLTFTPDEGIWMGASPELLVRLTENRYFETIALAGTQPFKPDVLPGDIAWTQKEIEEQALVSRYIINCFKRIRLREFEELGPKTVVAGNLIHLKTKFKVDMQATGFPDLGSTMLRLLHPTSAICGMPLENAESWLRQHENYDREFFSGYLGPVNIDDQTSLYVNLRCMKIESDSIRFFAGAGVTEDSRPEKEWTETEMKMNTLLNVIREYTTHI